MACTPVPEFCRLTMTLSQMLEGDFFNEYIKIGAYAIFYLRVNMAC